MTTPYDEIDIDHYLSSGDEVSRVYHGQGQSQPQTVATKLDKQILDYAHAAVSQNKSGQKYASRNFWWPLAMAASVIIGVVTIRTFDNPVPAINTETLAKTDVPVKTVIQKTPVKNAPVVPETSPKATPQLAITKPIKQVVTKNKPKTAIKTAKSTDTQFVKKATNDNPLIAPVNITLGEPDQNKIQAWYEKIEKLFENDKPIVAHKELAKFLKQNPRHAAALKLKKQHPSE